MRTTPAHDNVFDFNALLHPGTVFSHPRDVIANPNLSLAEKRAILASWASDASAIASCPALRAPDGLKAPVHIDEILEALRALDGNGPHNPPGGKPSCVLIDEQPPEVLRELVIRARIELLDRRLAWIEAFPRDNSELH
jgi:hypothetical protein